MNSLAIFIYESKIPYGINLIIVTLFNNRVSALKVIVAITSLPDGIGLAILLKTTKQPLASPFGKTTSRTSKFRGGLQRVAGAAGVVAPPVTADGVVTPVDTGVPGAPTPAGVIVVPAEEVLCTIISFNTIVLPLYFDGLL